MSIELATKYADYTDDLFKAESKLPLLTNTNFDWTGAHTVKVWKIGTAALNDYSRNRFAGDEDSTASLSRFGDLVDLDAQTEELMLKNDRSFIFNIDKLDKDETSRQLQEGTALARELREVVVPEVDTYTYGVMVAGAGTIATAASLTTDNVYETILEGSEVLDDNEVPDTERVLVVAPAVYTLLKKAKEFDSTDIGAEMRLQGVVGILDGMSVVKVPTSRLPEGFGFMIAHPAATVAPVKLEDYGTHDDTPLSSGTIVTGRICYDAFVLENKAKAIYYQPVA
ncbi:MAG: hypothetical protein LUD14_06500 [Clostridiales bacterium]|nr:hypothetical protein [Clostridiales bacterium]